MAIALYIASALGAVALFLMMPRRVHHTGKIGALLGALTLGGLWIVLGQHLPGRLGIPGAAMVYYYVFSGLAIVSAVRVITHGKPVYAALWFVLVILSSTGLLLVLGAEFMAFAMVMIYAGAILVTYVFVIMLAAHAGDPSDLNDSPEYDRVAHEPAAAVLVGCVLLASLLGVVFSPIQPNPSAVGVSDARLVESVLTDRAIDGLLGSVPGAARRSASVSNTERIGVELFERHPLGLELAGVILLVALIGAVVIARKTVSDKIDPAPPSTGAPGSATG